MPSITALLNPEPPRCPHHPEMLAEDHGLCAFCELTTHRRLSMKETPQQHDARMAAFHERFPVLAAVALRIPKPGMRTEAEAYDEGIIDDD